MSRWEGPDTGPVLTRLRTYQSQSGSEGVTRMKQRMTAGQASPAQHLITISDTLDWTFLHSPVLCGKLSSITGLTH
jgi:hypothetical protein